jgi:3-phosphoshikimate 1-carboxyvinyltransferase
MNTTIVKPPRGGTVSAIASKSHAHRALIAAALADGPTAIICGETNADIRATVQCLAALGAQIAYTDGIFAVTPLARPVSGDTRTLDCGESGSTLRFLLPVACALGVHASFVLHARLPQRPLSPLYEELTAHGCTLSPQGTSPLTASGKLTGGTFLIAGNVSSQFVTGLLLALPLLPEDSRIQVTGALESRPYVDITLQTLADFGIEIAQQDGGFIISGGQRFRSPGTLTVEGDWSNAACWLALGAVGREPVTVTGLNLESPQGDKAFLDLLARFGARVTAGGSAVTVTGGDLRGIDADTSANPDLVPMIAAVALAAKGRTRIGNAARLRLKESDRLSGIARTLRAFGAQIEETPDGLVIEGGRSLRGARVSSENDHRIAMMAAVASALCDGEVTIGGADAVNKSYPRFFDDLRTLGGQTREELP